MSKLLIDLLIHSAVVKLMSHAPIAREKTDSMRYTIYPVVFLKINILLKQPRV